MTHHDPFKDYLDREILKKNPFPRQELDDDPFSKNELMGFYLSNIIGEKEIDNPNFEGISISPDKGQIYFRINPLDSDFLKQQKEPITLDDVRSKHGDAIRQIRRDLRTIAIQETLAAVGRGGFLLSEKFSCADIDRRYDALVTQLMAEQPLASGLSYDIGWVLRL